MDPLPDPTSLPNPTTPDRLFARTKHVFTPNRISTVFAPSSQPAGSTQHALQASLTGNVVFANEAIVDAVFQPLKVDDQTVTDILAEINENAELKAARKVVLQGKTEIKKYKAMIALFEYITTYNHQEAPLMNGDYARHVRRHWIDTHGQSINTDPGVYLPGEIAGDEPDADPGSDDENNPATAGKKRKKGKGTRSGKVYSAKVMKTAEGSTPSTSSLTVLDNRRPDITLIDSPVDESILSRPYGRHACLFIEVKIDPSDKPNPHNTGTQNPRTGTEVSTPLQGLHPPTRVKSIVRQIADVARLHLATRAFMRYSLHITLCGTIFNICLFDRAGAVISKDYDLKNKGDFETFVRIIRRATCDMNAYELGLDPTVTPLGYLGSVAQYPRFKVEVGENSYYTHDFPIWQSTTLQGRGTWVFGATKDDNAHPQPKERLILKNAWRASGRLPESTLYGIIKKLQEEDETLSLRCVAEFVDGGDVTVEEKDGSAAPSETGQTSTKTRVVVRISGHRTFVEDAQLSTHNPTLHRVVLATRGQSMVSYTSLEDLLSAAECAAEGLRALSRLGVDHRDVSIGNVLLGTDPEKAAGFISDLDLASVSEEAIKAAYPNDCDAIIEQLKDGEWRTGTALFMAGELLGDLIERNSSPNFTFQHELHHDFESLIWVIIYAMMIHHRNILAATDQVMYKEFKEVLDACWAVHSYGNVLRAQNHMIAVGCSSHYRKIVGSWFPDAREAAFFRDAMRLLRDQTQDSKPVLYESLCTILRKHILLAKETGDSN